MHNAQEQREVHTQTTDSRILAPGRNCWRLARAERAAFLIDGADYFKAFRSVAARARHSIFVIGWDISGRVNLAPEGGDDGLPSTLAEFLDALARRHRGLDIYVLNWDFAVLYAMDREWLPIYRLDWRTHRRVHFCMDDQHPVGGSHHQKIVVADDAVAFVGGIDLTNCRWDTSEHRAEHPRRVDAQGEPCPPFHDVQMMVDGEAARAIGELARERWHRGTGKQLRERPAPGEVHDLWPEHVEPDLSDADIAISRTEPAYAGRSAVDEIRRLYLDSIAAAKRDIYLENQYFSSSAVGGALEDRLQDAKGPDVIIVSRAEDTGWLEEATMGVLRARLHGRLKEADSGRGRYRAYFRKASGQGRDMVNVHAKVMIVDDALVSIGSANLNNRSMGLDTECNLTVEAGGNQRIAQAIARLRARLLGEHLGTEPERLASETQRHSLAEAIESLRQEHRLLEELDPQVDPNLDEWLPESTVIDPEKPVSPERLIATLVPEEEGKRPVSRRLLALAAGVMGLFALAAAWRWTPMGDWLDMETLVSAANRFRSLDAAPLLAIGAFVAGGLLVIPITALIMVAVIVFGPVLGLAYAFVGVTLSAALTYGLGILVGRGAVRQLAGSRLNRLSRRLGRRGILTMFAVRLVPVAPFTVVNMVAGASHIGFKDFLVGSLLGMAPGMIAAALFIDRVVAAVREPGAGTFAVLGVAVLIIVLAAIGLRRWLRKHDPPAQSGETK